MDPKPKELYSSTFCIKLSIANVAVIASGWPLDTEGGNLQLSSVQGSVEKRYFIDYRTLNELRDVLWNADKRKRRHLGQSRCRCIPRPKILINLNPNHIYLFHFLPNHTEKAQKIIICVKKMLLRSGLLSKHIKSSYRLDSLNLYNFFAYVYSFCKRNWRKSIILLSGIDLIIDLSVQMKDPLLESPHVRRLPLVVSYKIK